METGIQFAVHFPPPCLWVLRGEHNIRSTHTYTGHYFTVVIINSTGDWRLGSLNRETRMIMMAIHVLLRERAAVAPQAAEAEFFFSPSSTPHWLYLMEVVGDAASAAGWVIYIVDRTIKFLFLPRTISFATIYCILFILIASQHEESSSRFISSTDRLLRWGMFTIWSLFDDHHE